MKIPFIIFRVFILLILLGRKSLIGGVNRFSVIDAMVRTLGKLLAPLSNAQTSDANHLDVTLIGWVLLFLSVCLDTIAIPSAGLEKTNEKTKEQGIIHTRIFFTNNMYSLNFDFCKHSFKRFIVSLGVYSRRICNAEKIWECLSFSSLYFPQKIAKTCNAP